jgi:hypothetical protein
MHRNTILSAALLVALWSGVARADGGTAFDLELVPRFNIPQMAKPPKIDGAIEPGEWQTATKVMGMVVTSTLDARDRPVSFWLAWDAGHLYLAYRSDILTKPTPHLLRACREKHGTSVVFDDALEFGLFLHDRNKKADQVSSYLKCVVNSIGAGEYMKNYPEIGQMLFNWVPSFDMASQVTTDAAGRHWWEMEIAMDLEDLEMPVEHKAGDRIDIGLFAVVHNPGWQWLDFPSASGHLERHGFPQAVLTADQPYVQVEEISGLHDRKLAYRSVVYNPADKPARVAARLSVQDGTKAKEGNWGELADGVDVFDEKKDLEIPAKGSVRFDVVKDLPGLKASDKGKGFLRLTLTPKDQPAAAPVYTYACNFNGTDKSYLAPADYKPALATRIAFTPTAGRLSLGVDSLDAPIPAGTTPAGATYKVMQGDKEIAAGKMRYFSNQWYDDLLELGDIPPGTYSVSCALVDAAGKELAAAKTEFAKQDDAKTFAAWWNNKIGDSDKLLQPFEALQVRQGAKAKTAIACTRRVYELGALGLPVQIEANGGPVLAEPARLVLRVDGKEHAVPVDASVEVTDKKDWRVDFKSAPVTVAGVTFSATGWMEQDGLVELALTYGPEKAGATVEIEALRIEWPIAQTTPDVYMASMGQGNNYSARTIGAVPAGTGVVWNTRDTFGPAGSGRRLGNFVGNLWIGTEQRGLFWCADSDKGWEPHNAVPAHAITRATAEPAATRTVVITNNLIGSADGKQPFKLSEPRTVRFGYNASPFKPLQPGFRLNSLSCCGPFSGGKYKVDWDTNQPFFTVLSPPFSNPARWPEYYAYCKDISHKFMYEGVGADGGCVNFFPATGSSSYYADRRHVFFTANQVPLRGYGMKSIESPNPYHSLWGDWMSSRSSEFLTKSYRDYMFWLMDRQIKEGGCQHFYFDITMGEELFSDPAAGFGYRLPDGRIQPESGDTAMREWYKRMWAMMQENDLYPGGVSGHSTHSFSLKMFPYADCVLDSEYPMQDSIDTYTSEAMIALSCPHTFGTNIQHHANFMNPTWAMMHDAAGGDYRGIILTMPEFKRWGTGRADIEFVPYWRNSHVVKEIGPGLIASLWRRPGPAGSAIVAVMNYGSDPAQPKRRADLVLDLAALGVPADAIRAGGDRVRIRQFMNPEVHLRYLETHPWAKAAQGKPLPPIQPKLDLATGTVGGFEIDYHDVKLLAIDWEEKPLDESSWGPLATDPAVRGQLLTWGINGAARLPDAEAAKLIQVDDPALKVEAWKRPGDAAGRGASLLLRLTAGAGGAPAAGTLKLDLEGLGVDVRKVWSEFTSVVALDGKPVHNRERADQKQEAPIGFNAYTGDLSYNVPAGESRIISIDRY